MYASKASTGIAERPNSERQIHNPYLFFSRPALKKFIYQIRTMQLYAPAGRIVGRVPFKINEFKN